MYKGEKVFKGEKEVKYVFEKSYKKTSGLVIVFSAFSAKGKPPRYNYVKTLEEFDCNKLFILDDFGCRASYYLCENRDFSIERSVISLIETIVKEHDIKTIISCGSSKGGYAALYYGIKFGFDHIIAASPQYLLGNYLLNQTKTNEVVKFMSGNDLQDDQKFLNNIMAKMISETKNRPNIYIHLGVGEYHYKNHVIPLIKTLEEADLKYELDLGDYDKHSDVARFYPPILKNKVRSILGFPSLSIDQKIINKHEDGIDVEYKANTEPPNKVAWYVYKDNKIIEKTKYSSDKNFKLTFKEEGKYKVKTFALSDDGLKVSLFSDTINTYQEQKFS